MNRGIYTTKQLAALQNSKWDIKVAMELGELLRIKRGLYATPDISEAERFAAEHRVQIGCVSAAALYGIWIAHDHSTFSTYSNWRDERYISTLPINGLHVILPNNARRIQKASIQQHRGSGAPFSLIADVRESLEHICRFHGGEVALVAVESALNLRLVETEDVDKIIRSLPKYRAEDIYHYSTLSESGSESRVKEFLRKRRCRVRQQVWIGQSQRVDILVGDWLIIECDSRAHHNDPHAYRNDRRRDFETAALGYTTIRLTWENIWLEWEETKALLCLLIENNVHKKCRLKHP